MGKRLEIMLCQPMDDNNLKKNFLKCSRMLAQPKLNGIRCWVRWNDHVPELVTSEGNLIQSLPHITTALHDWREQCGEIEFDGELYIHDSRFETVASYCRRRTTNIKEGYNSVRYCIFDFKSPRPNVERCTLLAELFSRMNSAIRDKDCFWLVPTKVISMDAIDQQIESYLKDGYEGIILRNPEAPYVIGRPASILKWKPSKSDIYTIVKVLEAVNNYGMPLARAGSLVCKDRFGNTFTVGLGMGMTRAEASKLWEDRKKLIGKGAKVYYQNLTVNGVPRFGRCNLIVEATDQVEEHF